MLCYALFIEPKTEEDNISLPYHVSRLTTYIRALYISTDIIGASIGAITYVAVTITKELFGTKGFSMNYNLLTTNIPLGSFAFGYGAASFYRKEGRGACMGMECYRTSFIIWGSLCAIGKLL